jgi:hypothetical protein
MEQEREFDGGGRRILISDINETRVEGEQPGRSGASRSPSSSMDGIDLGPPIATLRSLRALANDESGFVSNAPTAKARYHGIFHPISQGLLSIDDAQRAIHMYDDYPHQEKDVANIGI